MSKHIFFISSYPKSGNTLMRLIISALFFSKDGFVNFEILSMIRQLENIKILNFIKKENYNDFKNLNNLEILYKYHIKMKEKVNLKFKEDFSFFKTHHANAKFGKYPYVDSDKIRGIIYIVRDPRDIVLSWSNHAGINISESINFITNTSNTISWNKDNVANFPSNFDPRVLISSWENHALSWCNHKFELPTLIIRFEDLILKKEKTILSIINFFKLNYNISFINIESKLANIIESTNFEKLKQQEIKEGFVEARKGRFFNKGKIGLWSKVLNKEQIELIENKFGRIMKKFNYKLHN